MKSPADPRLANNILDNRRRFHPQVEMLEDRLAPDATPSYLLSLVAYLPPRYSGNALLSGGPLRNQGIGLSGSVEILSTNRSQTQFGNEGLSRSAATSLVIDTGPFSASTFVVGISSGTGPTVYMVWVGAHSAGAGLSSIDVASSSSGTSNSIFVVAAGQAATVQTGPIIVAANAAPVALTSVALEGGGGSQQVSAPRDVSAVVSTRATAAAAIAGQFIGAQTAGVSPLAEGSEKVIDAPDITTAMSISNLPDSAAAHGSAAAVEVAPPRAVPESAPGLKEVIIAHPVTGKASLPGAFAVLGGESSGREGNPSVSAAAGSPAKDAGEPGFARAQRKALALGLRYLYPRLTDEEIAQAVGVSRRTLFRWEEYSALKRAQRSLWRLPNGSKDADGNLEAWEDEVE
jgi:hypothetical protein